MTQPQELRIIKSRSQTTQETLVSLVTFVVVYYMLRPDHREKHLAFLRAQKDAVIHWYSIQNTLAAIRNLPETDVTEVTRNKEGW